MKQCSGGNYHRSFNSQSVLRLTVSLTVFIGACLAFPLMTALAQPAENIEEATPPPIKILSKEEKQQLEAEPNIKKHTQLALNLMEARLKSAEALTSENNYREALNTLGGFHLLLERTLGFLSKNNAENDKVLNNLKKLELTLREQTSRLEVMRRAMPSGYSQHVLIVIRAVRDARSRAIEPLFSDTVVPDRKP